MKKVLITGATGFLGGECARQMRARGWQVVATGRNPAIGQNLAEAGFTFHACDLSTDPEGIRRLASGCDAVVHCAALSSPWGNPSAFHAANVTATTHVLSACREMGVPRLVHISSPSVLFDYRDQSHLTEDLRWSNPPANAYIASKRTAEDLLRASDSPRPIILRPKGIIGPGDTTLVPRVIRVARRGSFPVFGGRDPLLDLTTITDAAQAICLATEAGPEHDGKTYHVTSGQALPASVAFRSLFEGAGLAPRSRAVSLDRALRIAGFLESFSRLATGGRWEPPITRYSVGALAYTQTLSIEAIRRDLGYRPGATLIPDFLRACGEHWRGQPTPAP